jgi:hypothetical protein
VKGFPPGERIDWLATGANFACGRTGTVHAAALLLLQSSELAELRNPEWTDTRTQFRRRTAGAVEAAEPWA